MALPVCTIDENGVTKPDYADILTYIEDQYKAIYGNDIYLEPDGQDGQLVAIFAAALNDANAMAVQVYNAFSPSTARGVGLSSVVKINGLSRAVASYSTVDVIVTGQAGTIISNGIAQGSDGSQWLLPASVTIPAGGDITVTATAKDVGAVSAASGTVTAIATPMRGWQSVTNPAAASIGAPVETDAQLRRRQSVSTMIPNQTVLEGILAAVWQVPNVTRLRGYENDTSTTDANGQPRNSIALVVDGGDSALIAATIAKKKAPGVQTVGTTSVSIVDAYGISHSTQLYRPTAVTIKVNINLTALTGYSTAIGDQIKAALVAYIRGQNIGQSIFWTRLFTPANLNGGAGSETFEINTLQIAKNAGSFAAADIAIAFTEAVTTTTADITITVV